VGYRAYLGLWGLWRHVTDSDEARIIASNIPGTSMPEYGFYIGVLLYAVLGSGIAFALGEQTIRGAFFAGIAAPALITNAITGRRTLEYKPARGKKHLPLFSHLTRARMVIKRLTFMLRGKVLPLNN
jgi:hypothetical protein